MADTKAAAVFALWIGLVAALSAINSYWGIIFNLKNNFEIIFNIIFALIGLSFMIMSIKSALDTIDPNIPIRDDILKAIDIKPKELFYIPSHLIINTSLIKNRLFIKRNSIKNKINIKSCVTDLSNINVKEIKIELIYELLKVSYYRMLKSMTIRKSIKSLKYFLITLVIYIFLRLICYMSQLHNS